MQGSLRGYLDALHLDASAWMPRFEESLQRAGIVSNNPEWTEFAEAVHRNRVVGAPGRRKRWLGVVALLLLLALATLGTWKYVVQPRLAPPVAAPAVTGQAAPEQTSPGGGVTN
jgi:cytoskeletal protein RodZ